MGILIPGEFVIIRPSTRARSRVKRYAEVAELVDAHDSGTLNIILKLFKYNNLYLKNHLYRSYIVVC